MFRVFAILFILASACAAFAEESEPDSRLLQKVTINCSGVRLHTAIERIAAQTGVTIRTGKNTQDWKVRDVPTLVRVQDLPLGTLLKAIADTNHMLFSSHKSGDVQVYRIWRDLRRESELTTLEYNRKTAAIAATEWDWDALCRIKDLPESAFTTTDNFQTFENDKLKAVANILSELGPEARDRVLGGEEIVLGNLNTPGPSQPYVKNAEKALWDIDNAIAERDGTTHPEPIEKLGNAPHVEIRFGRQLDYADQLNVEIWLESGYTEVQYWDFQRWLGKQLPDLPQRPTVPPAVMQSDELGAPYVKLDFGSKSLPAFLTAKFKVPRPKDKAIPTYQDLLIESSSAAGYSIIAEGNGARYRELVMSLNDEIPKFFDRDTTLKEVLEFSSGGIDDMVWYLDERHKLIIGRDEEWTVRLSTLVPEKVILDLHAKLHGKGVDIDDLEAMSRLTQDQLRDWFYISPEYPEMGRLTNGQINSELFRLYFDMKPSARKLALSGKPVPITFDDPAKGCSLLREQLKNELSMIYHNTRVVKLWPSATALLSLESSGALSEPEKLPQLRLRMDKRDLSKWVVGRHAYMIFLEDGDGHMLGNSQVNLPFPLVADDFKPKPAVDKPKPANPPK